MANLEELDEVLQNVNIGENLENAEINFDNEFDDISDDSNHLKQVSYSDQSPHDVYKNLSPLQHSFNYATKKLEATSPIPVQYLFTGTLALIVSYFISLIINAKKNSDSEKYIENVLRPKLLAQIAKNVEDDNKRLQEEVNRRKLEKEREMRRSKEEEEEMQRKISENEQETAELPKIPVLEDDEILKDLKAQAKEIDKNIQRITNENNLYQERYNQAVATINKYQMLNNSNDSNSSELSEEQLLKSQVEKLQKQDQTLSQKQSDLKTTKRKLQSEITAQKTIKRSTNEKKSSSDRKIKDLQRDIDNENRTIEAYQKIVDGDTKIVEQKQNLQNEKDEKLKNTESQIENLKTDFKSLVKECMKMNKSEKSTGKILSGQEKVEKLTDDSDLINQIAYIKESISSLEFEIDTVEDDFKEKYNQAVEMQKKFSDKEKEVADINRELKQWETKHRIVKEFHDKRENENSTALGVEAMEDKLNDQELEDLGEEEISLRQGVVMGKETNANLKRKVQELERKKRDDINQLRFGVMTMIFEVFIDFVINFIS